MNIFIKETFASKENRATIAALDKNSLIYKKLLHSFEDEEKANQEFLLLHKLLFLYLVPDFPNEIIAQKYNYRLFFDISKQKYIDFAVLEEKIEVTNSNCIKKFPFEINKSFFISFLSNEGTLMNLTAFSLSSCS